MSRYEIEVADDDIGHRHAQTLLRSVGCTSAKVGILGSQIKCQRLNDTALRQLDRRVFFARVGLPGPMSKAKTSLSEASQ